MAELVTATAAELTQDWIRRVVACSDELTYFGQNSANYAYAEATGQVVYQDALAAYKALVRRGTLLGAEGDAATEVAAELGAQRLGPTRAMVLVIVRPQTAVITAITDGRLEVSATDAALFAVNDSLRLTTNDGATSEVVEIQAITSASGPNGGSELDVGLVLNTYDPDKEIVRVLLRKTLTAGTVFTSTAGIRFESLDDLTIGDSNAAMAGESASLALADKVWCEATTAGAAGNVEALTISLQTPDADVLAVLNPSRASGGTDAESLFDLKYRAAHQSQFAAAETPAMLEALAKRGNNSVLRAVPETSTTLGRLRLRVLTRSGGGLSADARTSLSSYMSARLRSQLVVEILNMEVTAVEVTADVTLDPVVGLSNAQRLARAWRHCADALAVFLDFRKWEFGVDVDEADLLSIVNRADGIATVAISSFTPASDVVVAAASLPVLVRLTLTDTATNEVFGAVLEPTYG